MTFGTRLRELREDSDTTQKELAAIINVSPRMVSYFESGQHFPRDSDVLIRLAEYFGVSLDYLLGCSDSPASKQTQRLNKLFSELPDQAKQSALDYLEYLRIRYHKKS